MLLTFMLDKILKIRLATTEIRMSKLLEVW